MHSAVLDTAPLLATPTRTELRAYRRGHGHVRGPRVRVRPCLGGLSYTALLVLSGGVTALLAAAHADPRVIALGCAAAAASAVGAFLCARATRARACLREYRLAVLAARNGLVYERGAAVPSVPGLRYTDGRGRSLRRFSGRLAGQPVEAGNFQHHTGEIAGYVIVGSEVAIVPPFDFAEPGEWHRVGSLLTANA